MKQLIGIALCTALGTAACSTTTHSPAIERVHYGDWEREIGYTQVVRVGNTLHLSGVVAGGATMEEQLVAVYRRIESILNDFDATLDDIVSEILFTTDMEATKAASSARHELFSGNYPAASWIQIERLYSPGALVEVEVRAVVPD